MMATLAFAPGCATDRAAGTNNVNAAPVANVNEAPAPSAIVHDTILAAFAADSLALGAHWEYNTDTILKTFHGKVDHLAAPISSYHRGKLAGDQTHTGDNSLFLLETIAAAPLDFSIDKYVTYWRSKWDVTSPPGYVDHATKATLAGLRAGKHGKDAASTDDDMSHSAKFFPLLALFHSNEQSLVDATKQLVTAFQQGAEEEVTGEWLARVAFRVLVERQRPSSAIDAVTAELGNAWLTDRVRVGKASSTMTDLEALRSYGETKQSDNKTTYTGLSCSVANGVPAVVHYVSKYEDAADPTTALIEDVSVGGNSNARSIATATLLFGYRGLGTFKINELVAGLRNRQHIEDLLRTIAAISKHK